MNNDEKILKTLEDLRSAVEAIKAGTVALRGDVTYIKEVQQKQGKQVDTLVDVSAHVNTAVKSLATKQDIETTVDAAKSELKADIFMLDAKVVKKIQSHDRR